jgi:hypothetical protein
MNIITIFTPQIASPQQQGLLSIQYDGEENCEFDKLFDYWENAEYMVDFCLEHAVDVYIKFGYAIDPEAAAQELMDEADDLLEMLVRLARGNRETGILQHLFKPLNNHEFNIVELQLSKGSATTKLRKNTRLRIYAVRIGDNTYVVTGGAIKLTDRMEQRDHTNKELTKLKMVRSWLKSEGISYPEDLNYIL